MAVTLRSSQRTAKFQIQIKISENALFKNVAHCIEISEPQQVMKKINPEAIAVRTCKSVGLCTGSADRGDLSSPCDTTQGGKDKPGITGAGLQEPLPLG